MKPKVYKDESWVLKVYTSGWIPVKLTGFSSANDAINALNRTIISCIIGGHVLIATTRTTFCKNCGTNVAIWHGVSKED